jgi:hypothetical protein
VDGPFELHGTALLVFAITQAALLLNLVGESYARVIECRRRSRQRERELAALEAFHSLEPVIDLSPAALAS